MIHAPLAVYLITRSRKKARRDDRYHEHEALPFSKSARMQVLVLSRYNLKRAEKTVFSINIWRLESAACGMPECEQLDREKEHRTPVPLAASMYSTVQNAIQYCMRVLAAAFHFMGLAQHGFCAKSQLWWR